MVTFGGDEISSLVFDFGSHSCKIGYSGQDTPTHVFPSVIGTTENNTTFNTLHWQPNLNITTPTPDQLLAHSYSLLRSDPSEHPLFFIQQAWTTSQERENIIQLSFESYKNPAVFLARSPVMSAFSAGKATALVIDAGASQTSVVPVHDGYVLKKGIRHQPIGGDFVSNQILTHFQKSNIDIVPLYQVKSKSPVDPGVAPIYAQHSERKLLTTDSFHDYQLKKIADDFKETVCQVSEVPFNPAHLSKKGAKNYEFPNGYNNSFKLDRFRIPEVLFDPRHVLQNDDAMDTGIQSSVPLSHMIRLALSNVDVDLRGTLLANIVITGGTSLTPGYLDRVNSELHALATGAKIKIHASATSAERKFGAWTGGSIMSSLGTFHQLWISKQQYEEMGTSVEKRLH